ncbi:hypothetical protein PENANT_c077G05654 [Penicillium antarcticum]|uniref:Uncharacterized protein n=1 Tax=Penicillium antarcticum TaxID=416450 RepID=A0A1V6PP80_9EURO|nr:hypothetical protein PENANT_c077G05654 [Penicillium antarcticum]
MPEAPNSAMTFYSHAPKYRLPYADRQSRKTSGIYGTSRMWAHGALPL